MKTIKTIKQILSNDENWRVLFINFGVPSVNAVFKPINRRCDISVSNGLGVYISEMIGYFFEIQPEAIKFYHCIKIWLNINQISIRPFHLTLLVVHFCQTINLMPSAKKAQMDCDCLFLDGIPVGFNKYSLYEFGLQELFDYKFICKQFFQYYGKISIFCTVC